MKPYRIKKSLHVFRHVLKLYRRKRKRLNDGERQEIADTLNHLQEEILSHDREKADAYAKKAEKLCHSHLKKTPFERMRDFIVALACALLVAVAIRTIWFEFYEIPTGSMRPTFEEQDRLVVSKTSFGINIPLRRGHIYFNPELLLRNGIIIFTGSGMDISDVNTLYFYIFPGKKQYVKRMMGKPGDVLYFYGGQIYGIDENGKDISHLLQPEDLKKIDHVPYIHLNGKMILPSQSTGGIYAPVTLKQMNLSVAKLEINPQNKIIGKLLPPFDAGISDYYDLWGFKNYGIARLLTKEEISKYSDTPVSQLGEAPLYMEIIHHPSVKHPKIERDHLGRLQPSVGTSSSILPLSEKHLKTLFDNLYTARFIVKDGKASRYGSSMHAGSNCRYCPELPGVPDGTYEFYYGKAYQVYISGVTKELPKDHPLYAFSIQRIQTLYNLGIEFATYYAPMSKDQYLLPSRYVYFYKGALYAMGAPLIEKEDPTLLQFTQREYLKQQNAPSYRPHIPFEDSGPPYKNGEIDVEFIKQYGVTIPPQHYLALGDNYAMSADSRDFGFVPASNIRGAPTFIFWPPGHRFGFPPQAHYLFYNSPRSAVWVLALIAFIGWYIYHRKHHKLPLKIE